MNLQINCKTATPQDCGKILISLILNIFRCEWMDNTKDFCHSLLPMNEDEAFVDGIIRAHHTRFRAIHSDAGSSGSEIASDDD